MSETDVCVARTVSALADLNGLSLKRLAERVDMPYRTVQNYLTGEVKIPSEFIAKCCRIFTVESDCLLFNKVDLVQEAFVPAVHDVIRSIVAGLQYDSGELRLRESGTSAFDDPVARDFHESALLTQIAAAIRHSYVRRRLADLADEAGSPTPKAPTGVPLG